MKVLFIGNAYTQAGYAGSDRRSLATARPGGYPFVVSSYPQNAYPAWGLWVYEIKANRALIRGNGTRGLSSGLIQAVRVRRKISD